MPLQTPASAVIGTLTGCGPCQTALTSKLCNNITLKWSSKLFALGVVTMVTVITNLQYRGSKYYDASKYKMHGE